MKNIERLFSLYTFSDEGGLTELHDDCRDCWLVDFDTINKFFETEEEAFLAYEKYLKKHEGCNRADTLVVCLPIWRKKSEQ